MALSTPSLLETKTGTSNATSLTSDAFTPTAGSLLIVVMAVLNTNSAYNSGVSGSSTITGQGDLIKRQEKFNFDNSRSAHIEVWTSQTGANPTSGTVTINWSLQTNRNLMMIYEVTGHDADIPVGGLAHNKGTANTLVCTMNGTPQDTSMIFAAVASASGTTDPEVVPGTGFTELDATSSTGSTARIWLETAYDIDDADTTADWSSLPTVSNVGVAIEINLDETGADGGSYIFTDGYDENVWTAKDNLINSGAPTYNLGEHANFEVGSNNSQYGLIEFDLSNIPSGMKCVEADLYLYHSYAAEAGSVTVAIYPLTSANAGWLAGEGNIALAADGESCWNAKAADGSGGVDTAWAGGAGCDVSGTDYEATPIATFTFPAGTDGIGTEYVIGLDTDTVEDWFGTTNPGLIMRVSAGTGGGHLGQSDNGTIGYRPKLEIEYDTGSVTHVLYGSDLDSGVPVIDQPTITQIDALVASDLDSGVPVLDNPTLGQTHVLHSNDITTDNVVIDNPTLGQTHILLSSDLDVGSPVLDNPTLGQTHILWSSDLDSGSPALDNPTLGQTHILYGSDLDAGVPIIDNPSMDQTHSLYGSDLDAGIPIIDNPTLGQTHILLSSDLDVGSPIIDNPTLGQTHILWSSDLDSGSPVIDNPALGQTHVLLGSDLDAGVPIIDNPSIAMEDIVDTPTERTYTIEADDRVYVVDSLEETMKQWQKDPDSGLDYVWDWTKWLGETDRIASYEFLVPDDITLRSHSIKEDRIITAWMVGGVDGYVHPVVCRIETVEERKEDKTALFFVNEH